MLALEAQSAVFNFTYESSVGNCAAVCLANPHCVAFEMVTNGACKPMWSDRKGQGYCGLMKQHCHPVHLGMECWDQYEMTESGVKLWIIVTMISFLLILLLLLLKFKFCQRAEQLESDSETEDERWLDPAWCAISMFQLLELHDKAGSG